MNTGVVSSPGLANVTLKPLPRDVEDRLCALGPRLADGTVLILPTQTRSGRTYYLADDVEAARAARTPPQMQPPPGALCQLRLHSSGVLSRVHPATPYGEPRVCWRRTGGAACSSDENVPSRGGPSAGLDSSPACAVGNRAVALVTRILSCATVSVTLVERCRRVTRYVC